MAQRPKRPTLTIKADIPLPEHAEAIVEGVGPSIRDIKDRIEALFHAIGSDRMPDTCFPGHSKNNSTEANEYALADLLEQLAKKRKKAASEAAAKAGVFGDPDKYVNGETVMVWQSPHLAISVKTGNPTRMLGKEETEAAIRKHLPRKFDEVMDECMKDRAATKQIIVSMK